MSKCYHDYKATTVEAEEAPGIVLTAECEKCGEKIRANDLEVHANQEGIDRLEVRDWVAKE